MIPTALDGVRVLDFSRVLAGPFCTMLLADLGADVIKIEQPGSGDETRQWGPPWQGAGQARHSAYFISVNRNKRSLTLNLGTTEGQALARRLAAASHIVVENFTPGHMARFGLDYPALAALNPALVYGSITGFGQQGPYSSRPGYDYAIQAMSGLMAITGPPDGEPHKVGVAISDVITGLYAASSLLAALHHSQRTGQGQHVDIALLDCQLAALVNVASNYLVSGQPPPRYGNQHPNIVPYQTFRAADADFVLAVGNDRQFAQVCACINRPDLPADPRYATNPARVAHRAALAAELQAAFAQRPAADWVADLLALGIPAAPINDLPTIIHDPHVQARGLVGDGFIGPAPVFSATPAAVRLPPPRLGEHSESILGDMGLDAATIDDYRQRGII
jgi:crotonobetainyl-CoA:carnitine CoA-transferase CaiB-like acyl-CoA transferase